MGHHNTKQSDSNTKYFMFGNQNGILTYQTKSDTIDIQYAPKDVYIYENMAGVVVDRERIYLSGGINKSYTIISDCFLKFNPKDNQFSLLPDMINGRYTHSMQYNKYIDCLYATGGRTYGQGQSGIMAKCEKFCFASNKWIEIHDLTKPRATHFSIIFNKQLYVFGGYSGIKKRTKAIEFYDEQKDKWNIIKLKLKYGVEQGTLASYHDDIMIIGGQTKTGPTNQCQCINFKSQKSYLPKFKLQEARVLQKGFQEGNNIYQLFGKKELSFEKGNINSNSVYLQICNIELLQKFGDYNFSGLCGVDQPIEVGMNLTPLDFEQSVLTIIVEQSLFRINLHDFSIIEIPITTIPIVEFMGAIQLSDDSIIIMGGVSKFTQISKSVFQIKVVGGKLLLKQLKDMEQFRYAFGCTKTDEFIYVAGGRVYGGDDSSIIPHTERYRIKTNTWEQLTNLNEKRCSPIMFTNNSIVYIGGGYIGNHARSNTIEMYDENQKQWLLLGIQLTESFEACFLHNQSTPTTIDLLIFGGRTIDDTNKISRYSFNLNTPLDTQVCTYELIDQMPFKGSLLKGFMVQNKYIIIMQIINKTLNLCTFDTQSGKVMQNIQLEKQITSMLEMYSEKLNNLNRMIMIQ